ncbi:MULTISPECIES: SDR family oxidoreductase [unclassified Paenibacillus]|uniref:SDR family oxidoreductase n=1 Tax=unclassified Paenibacillus TaxID=185978 RepID=UPI001C119282|nr:MULTISPECIES: SDR family oxidoreductase [unclassified Paenibacillus]MBU5443907.1 SDR family oxidoreductase [Paenibacillus sp. MSJ-34]CAH0121212.1 NADPH-dependent reductase BacG [Paenibacillus sp. CECT 9249]
MDLQLQGRTAIVLASSKGLGKATALQLAKEGANVTLSGRSEETLRLAAEELEAAAGGRKPLAVQADVTKADDIARIVRETAERFGAVDILINNAGGPAPGTFDRLTDEQWQQGFELTLLSFVRSIREALPYMRKQRFGRIVNFTSTSMKQPIDNLLLSTTFRVGVMGLAKSLASELAPSGILINTLGPGRFATDRVLHLDGIQAEAAGMPLAQIQAQEAARIPLGRYGEPEEFGRLAAFLASPANSYMTGQALLIDGGVVKAM